MKFLSSNLSRLYAIISYRSIDESTMTSKEKDHTILLNQYFFLLSIIFFLHSLFTFIFIGLNRDTFALLCISTFFFVFFLLFKNLKGNRYIISFVFILICLIITFYSSFCGIESGVYLYYYPTISAVFIFLSWKSDRYFVLFLILFIILNLYTSAFSNFQLFDRNVKFSNFRHIFLILNVTCMLFLLALNSYFFHVKREDYYFIVNRNLYKREQIDNLSNEILRLKKLMNKDAFSEEALKDLIKSIQLNDVIFIEKFETFFPDFFIKLNSMSSTFLTVSDLKFCAMLKLGFSTKQIAIYTNSTIKSVEGKKYRLRKKLNISIDDDSKNWMSVV